ncbi:hypothetical protein QFC22_003585 [Naganishia vaughanmartiniae]|uniref:Uncharacterized protein n=1 Tax=Naganishia vaughanmartiniae TaxID=1424756 RepID=A0ACC2X501_9TREE|nr:hypothetical protein QFC22_003585 [Naganishia vaughanmartiniae]
MELLSDPFDGKTAGFHFPAINYEDPNLNVAIPVFSIHGNHDDPQGTGPEGALCALDVLSVAGLVNYFGKVHLASDEQASDPTSDGMQIKPVLLQKGKTRLAMYGVGNIKDARMHYELRSNRVRMFMPEEDEDSKWFNMLLIHQNRVKHGPQNSVPEGMFDDSIDLVVWGHEHDCRIEPEGVPRKNYWITQPGSSVATSLSQGESIQKKVGILSIQGDQFDIEPVALKTVRPFKIGEVIMEEESDDPANELDLQSRDSVTAFLEKKVDELIAEAKEEWESQEHDPEDEMMLPLIRLKVETTGVKEMMNAGRFGQRFVDRIANPKDVLQYYRKKVQVKRQGKVTADQPDLEDLDDLQDVESGGTSEVSRVRMGELVSRFLEAQTLEVLAENALEEAVTRYVDKDDTDAIRDVVNSILESATKGIKSKSTEETIDNQDTFRELITKEKEAFASQPFARAKTAKKSRTQRPQSDDSMIEEDDFPQQVEDSDVSMSSTTRGGRKTATKGKSTTTAKTAATQKKAAAPARGGKKAAPLFADDDDDEEEEEEEFVPRAQRGAGGRAAVPKKPTAASKKTPAKTPAKKAAATRAPQQSQLSFVAPSQPTQSASRPSRTTASKKTIAIDISDDDD